MVDTNSNPSGIDFVIPANDDASKSIDLIVSTMCTAIKEGIDERNADKEMMAAETQKKQSEKKSAAKAENEETEEE